MFTGIIEYKGEVTAKEQTSPERLAIVSNNFFADSKVGDSIAIDGTCLTIIEHNADSAIFEVADETLRLTTLGSFTIGQQVNLEKPMQLGARLDGHIVQGHVDGVGTISKSHEDGADLVLTLTAPSELLRHIVHKGSITINGTSLTVTEKTDTSFSVMLIPHTREITTLGSLKPEDNVNIEVDVLSKYVAAHLAYLNEKK